MASTQPQQIEHLGKQKQQMLQIPLTLLLRSTYFENNSLGVSQLLTHFAKDLWPLVNEAFASLLLKMSVCYLSMSHALHPTVAERGRLRFKS